MSLRLFELGLLAFIVLFTGLYSLIMPNLTRRDLLFGVTVAPDARSTDQGRRIVATLSPRRRAAHARSRWRRSPRSICWRRTSGSTRPGCRSPSSSRSPPVYPLSRRLWRQPRAARLALGRDACHPPPPPSCVSATTATMSPGSGSCCRSASSPPPPATSPRATPARPPCIPIHFDLNGNPNGYATKSIGSYFSMVWTQLGIEVLITGLSVLVVGSKAVPGRSETTFRRIWLRALYVMKTLLLLLFAFIAVVIAESAASGRGPTTGIIFAPDRAGRGDPHRHDRAGAAHGAGRRAARLPRGDGDRPPLRSALDSGGDLRQPRRSGDLRRAALRRRLDDELRQPARYR